MSTVMWSRNPAIIVSGRKSLERVRMSLPGSYELLTERR